MNLPGGIRISAKRGNGDELTVLIDKMVGDLSRTSSRAIPSIHRVRDSLRSINEKAYDPTTVAIGPIHRNKAHLKKMDHQKKKYLKLLLDSMGESSVDRYVREIRYLEERARECYADDMLMGLGKDDFVLMLLLDGIFILEFFRRLSEFNEQKLTDEDKDDDIIFQFDNVIGYVIDDLFLFENQIPFFVLEKLLELTKTRDRREIADLFWPLLISTSARNLLQDGSIYKPPPHLLGLVHYAESLQFSPNLANSTYEMKNINSASELKEAGIIFKKRNDTDEAHLLDIKFDKKIIYIPTLRIEDSTESKFRNLIAYEQYLPHRSQRKFTDYMFFMHCLIHDPRDAKLLRRCGVISTWAGGDEMVYCLIKQMGKNVQPSVMFSYGDVFEGVNHHCTKRKNTWMAVLRRDYFDSPWKVISLVAGFVLLGVGIVQMVFAILSYYQDPEKHK
ncbi:hypothetical protein ABFS83_14G170800 [Erythranthe nasuta]